MTERPAHKRKWVRFAAWLVGSFALALIITFLLHRPSMKVIAQWKQPADITYDQWGPYYLSVVESDRDWRGFPLQVERNHLIYVGRDAGKPSYGHMLDFSFYPVSDSTEEFVKKSKVRWTPEGVTLATQTGHRVFIPKGMFTGGR